MLSCFLAFVATQQKAHAFAICSVRATCTAHLLVLEGIVASHLQTHMPVWFVFWQQLPSNCRAIKPALCKQTALRFNESAGCPYRLHIQFAAAVEVVHRQRHSSWHGVADACSSSAGSQAGAQPHSGGAECSPLHMHS